MSSVLITVSGPDRPGVTGGLFTSLATHRVEVLDIDQAVIRGQLTLGVLVGTPEDPDGLRNDVELAMGELGMDVRVAIDQPGDDRRRFPTHAVVVLGRPLQAGSTSRRSSVLPTIRSPDSSCRFGRLTTRPCGRPLSRSEQLPAWTSRWSGSGSRAGRSG
jgi:phosphoserine phosphatase